ncbi:MAG: hypothetical protein IT379_42630 [Deltaproteobacteria bacterium]|nr:hypothetical protein [Deltaproteobacteria bacterium]
MSRPARVAIAFSIFLFAGCPDDTSRPPRILDPDGDVPAPPPDDLDSDGDGLRDFEDPDDDNDGLCDDTEAVRNSDPFVPDTDNDGYPDVVEAYSLFTDPIRPEEPVRGDVTFLPERMGRVGEASATFEIVVRGRGETFYAALESFSNENDAGELPTDFFRQLVPLRAEPAPNVAAIDDIGFRVVQGETRLTWRADFVMDPERTAQRFCMRAMTYQVWIKRDAGTWGIWRAHLVVAPPGVEPSDEQWCAPLGTLCY